LYNQCRRCGKESTEGQIYCPPCREGVGAGQTKVIWLTAGLFSALLLTLAGMLLWHGQTATWDLSWDRIMMRPAATINGEAIDRQDFRARAAANRRISERQFGTDIFSGKDGQAQLMILHKHLLERMVEERLILQEAKRLGVSITNEQVEQELHRITREVYGYQDNLQKRLRLDGMTSEGMKNQIRTIMTTQALMKVKAASLDSGSAPEAAFTAWLTQTKNAARVVLYDSSSAVVDSPRQEGGCCASGGSFSAVGDDK
jgi:hypothetical protein